MVAVIVVVGTMCVLNLLLTFAVLRRLRRHAELLEAAAAGPEDLVGRTVPDFAVVTGEGVTVGRAELAGREYLIGFFSANCAPCRDQAPQFARLADADPRAALSVVVGDGASADEIRTALVGVPTAVVGLDDPITRDFGVNGYPTMVAVDAGGTVVSASASVRSLASSGATARLLG